MPQDREKAAAFPYPPLMPTTDAYRAEHQWLRWCVAIEHWDDLAADWLAETVDEQVLQVWGPPDTSVNPLVDVSRQLSTPGLYGRGAPMVRHDDRGNQGLVGPGGEMSRARYWSRGPYRQFLTLAVGDWIIRPSVKVENGTARLVYRDVYPWTMYAEPYDDEPDRAIMRAELRLRYDEVEGVDVYAWDMYHRADPTRGGLPSWRVLSREADLQDPTTWDVNDVSARFLRHPDGSTGALVGPAYLAEFGASDGEPLLPFVHFRSEDTGAIWSWTSRRGAFRGTLNTMAVWTYVFAAGRHASGEANVALDCKIQGAKTLTDRDNSGSSVRSLAIMPGTIVHASSDEGKQGSLQRLEAGAELQTLLAFANTYEQKQSIRWGLNPSDSLRTAANPTSGASLALSNEQKRETSAILGPVFRRADLDAVRLSAVLLDARNAGAYAETGYTVEYIRIPPSPQERRDQREQDERDLELDLTDPIEIYIREHPGASEDDATTAIVRARVRTVNLDRLTAEALAAAGLTEPTPDAPPPTAEVDDVNPDTDDTE